MRQTQTLQPTSASWAQQEAVVENDVVTKINEINSKREKARSTSFLLRSTFAGGLAGCTV